jgi:hypothetical protein
MLPKIGSPETNESDELPLGGFAGQSTRRWPSDKRRLTEGFPAGATGQLTCVVTLPGKSNWMTPPQLQVQTDPLASAGIPPTKVCGAVGVQDIVTGTHGMGVRTPSAAAVAAATVGLDGVVHIPKGGMFTSGLASVMVAIGRPSTIGVVGRGRTFKLDGANPKLHCITAPLTTACGMGVPPLRCAGTARRPAIVSSP